MHCFEFGLPERCFSDLGSQFQAGANLISDFLNDPETQLYFEQNGIKSFSFEHYYKGHSELGSLVEICVKLTKRLIYGAIKNQILSMENFEFLISYVIHLANKRPIAFKEALRDPTYEEVPEPISPELLIRGYELNSVNIIPDLHEDHEEKPIPKNYPSTITDSYFKLRKARNEMIKIYENEFLGTLISQAVNKNDRYRPIKHNTVKVGDIVLLKEPNLKPNHYPMGVIKTIIKNDLDEITGATILKGKTRDIVKRHSSTIIPILEVNVENEILKDNSSNKLNLPSRKKRKAAVASQERSKYILSQDI